VPVPDGPVDPAVCDATAAAFHDAHHRRYGYSFRDDPTQQVEWVNLRVTGVGPIRRPTLRPLPREKAMPDPPAPTSHPPGPAAAGTRPACFDPSHGFVDTAIYRRDDLSPGELIVGPAVVEEYGATVPLPPGFQAEVDRFGNLVVTRREESREPRSGAPVDQEQAS
jgi:N-methylhydantoinase A